MSPPTLQPYVVAAILANLSPLEDIPPHLLSIPLRQRHHFLAISPYDADPAAYLAWPLSSPEDKDTLDQLLAALPSAVDAEPMQTYRTVYSHDGESSYAHVNVPVYSFALTGKASAGLRLVFRWEGDEDENDENHCQDGWKYHDCKPMPFPSGASNLPEQNSSPSPQSPVSPATPPSATVTLSQKAYSALDHILTSQGHSFHSSSALLPSIMTPPPEPSHAFDDDDDDYWNSYGQDSDDEGKSSKQNKAADDENAEGAYWARYNSVHGTADSTIPSPQPAKQPLLDSESDSSHDLYVPSISEGPREYDPDATTRADYLARLFMLQRDSDDLNPGPHDLSPHALELRLHSISPRPPPLSASQSVQPSPAPGATFGFELDIDGRDSDDSLTASPPPEIQSPRPRRSESNEHVAGLGRNANHVQSQADPTEQDLDSFGMRRQLSGVAVDSSESSTSSSDAAVRDALKGIYRLWAPSRLQNKDGKARLQSDFLDIVRDVISDI